MHAPEAIKEYKEAQKDKRRLRSRTSWSITSMSSSPISLSSNSPTHLDILDALVATPIGDLAEARAAFPTPEPGHLSPDSTFSVDVDLSPATRIDAVGVEAEVGCMEGGAGAEDMGGAAGVSPEVGSRCTCSLDLPDAGPCTCRGRPRRPVRFETPSACATPTAHDAPSVRASSRTVDATPSPLTGARYFACSKESWRQLVERIRHHKSPKSSSQHNNDNISSDSPTAIQRSTEKRGRKSPQRHELEEDKEGGKTGGGGAHQRSSKRAKKYKGE